MVRSCLLRGNQNFCSKIAVKSFLKYTVLLLLVNIAKLFYYTHLACETTCKLPIMKPNATMNKM